MGQSTKYNTGHESNAKAGCRHEINMVRITKEGKEINEKNRSTYCGWDDRLWNQAPRVPIQFIFKPRAIPKRQLN
jgi:hypothetical protein